MGKLPAANWLYEIPDTTAHSPASLAKRLERINLFVRSEDAPSMQDVWQGLTASLAGPSTNNLLAAGHAIAARIDKGIGAGVGNDYHHAAHFKDVMFSAATLVHVAGLQGKPLTRREQAVLLFTALVHDYDHDGGRNRGNALRLEEMALRGITADFKQHNINPATQEMIGLMLRSTDVSRSPDYVSALKVGMRVKAPEGYESLAPLGLARHRRTAELAAMLRDADILMAAGVTGVTARDSKSELGREWNEILDYKDHLGFLNFVVSQPDGKGGRSIGFASEAGQFFNPNIGIVAHSLAQRLRPARLTNTP